jgi:hypothetical protein
MQGLSLWRCPAEQPWFPEAEHDQRRPADLRASALYKVCRGTPTKRLGKVQNAVLCTYEASSICLTY